MTERLKGSQLIADLLEGYGVTHVFFIPTILNHTLYEMEQRTRISRVLAHSEKAAAYMADGYARASGRVGVCMAQMVGAANLAAGLRDGWMASTPLIAVTGGASKNSRDRYQYQEVNDGPAFLPYTKASTRVDSLERLAPTIRQAFRTATTGRPGPVHIELENHHGDALELQEGDLDPSAEIRFGQLPPFRPSPDPADVDEAVRLLTRSSRPVIVAGGGVRYSGARATLVAFAEQMSIPVAASLSGKDVIPADHPLSVGVVGLYSREAANRVVSEADLVFYVGSKTGSLVTHSWRFPSPDVTVIQSDISGDVAGVNYPNAASLVGDARVTLEAMSAAAGRVEVSDERVQWLERVRGLVADWYAETDEERNSDAVPIRPERLLREVSDALPSDAVVVADTGHSGVWTAGHLDLRSESQGYIRAAGSLGWAFPGALGAQCALPDRPVVCFTGDGGLYYHMAELETMARWNIPATIVVNNNNSFNQEIPLWTSAYGGELRGRHGEMWQFSPVNFAGVAREMGLQATRVEDPADLSRVLKESIGSGAPTVIEVMTDLWATAPKPALPS